jgi:hypothetical protein
MTTYRITHLAGRARSGGDRTGFVTHAVINEQALCGKEPGRKSAGWSSYNDPEITCPKCKKLAASCAYCGNVLELGEGSPSKLYNGLLCDACYELEPWETGS